jgi:hypothetical protein
LRVLLQTYSGPVCFSLLTELNYILRITSNRRGPCLNPGWLSIFLTSN